MENVLKTDFSLTDIESTLCVYMDDDYRNIIVKMIDNESIVVDANHEKDVTFIVKRDMDIEDLHKLLEKIKNDIQNCELKVVLLHTIVRCWFLLK